MGADFGEVVRQWRRMCVTIGGESCGGCTLFQKEGSSNCLSVYEGDIDCDLVESVVMAWAKEHPEPVYPQWWQYLSDIGVLPNELTPSQIEPIRGILKSMPADIARKLGLEPIIGGKTE